jgi:hypothetical protein
MRALDSAEGCPMRTLFGIAGLALVAAFATGCAVGIRGTATEITTNGAVLNGRVVSTAGGATTYYFEFGRGDQLQQTAGHTLELTKGLTQAVSAPLDGLEPGGPYRFRVCAEDGENPGDPFCSPFRAFSIDEAAGQDYAVGEFSNGLALFVVDVRSDPTGGNPVGEVTADQGRLGSETAHVACLRVTGNRATIGLQFPSAGDGFFFLEDNPAGQDRFRPVALAAGQSVTDCPETPATLDPISPGTISVHDAPPSP